MDPFMAQSAALSQSGSNWQALTVAAGEGRLVLEKGAAEECAKHCEDMVTKLAKRVQDSGLSYVRVGMGNCLVGKQLADKFAEKAAGAPSSLMSVINQHQTVLKEMATAFRAAGRAYEQQEDANKRVIGG